jgi:DNA polymerase epsilon subunit 2
MKISTTINRAYFGNTNYFGGPLDISCKSSIALSQAQSSVDTMIVFLSDVWLDSEKVRRGNYETMDLFIFFLNYY